jgi:O-antigen/teichoic acid export membrane protein
VACAVGATALTAALVAVLHLKRDTLLASVPPAALTGPFLFWFYATTLGVTWKLVLYGGLNGLRRLTAQTALEMTSLAVQVAWIFALRHRLDLESLFMILGVVSLGTVAVGAPWYNRHLRRDTRAAASSPTGGDGLGSYRSYWLGATGLSLVALAFTDVDRYVLSGVLALEMLSLFHIGSRVVRLANRFLGIPVLAFQPEVSRVDAEGRGEDVEASTRVFLKFNVVVSMFVAMGVSVFAAEIIRLIANPSYLSARPLLVVLSISIPLTAMTAPLTSVMKALDEVRRAFYCDLAWSVSYLVSLLVLGGRYGLLGAGYATIVACVIQLLLAGRLSRFRLGGVMVATAWRGAVACTAAFAAPVAAAWLPVAGWAQVSVRFALAVLGLYLFRRLVLGLGVFDLDERVRLADMVGRAGPGRFLGRVLS